mgnify:CR=1 FL=1
MGSANASNGNVYFNTRAACLAYRSPSGRGQVVTSLANDFVGIVQDPAAAPVEVEPTSYVPAVDNTTDLGTSAFRFRSGYFGTSLIVGAAATGQALIVYQPAANQGDLIPGAATVGLRLVGAAGDPNGAKLTTAATGVAPVFESFGTEANIGLTVQGKGTGGVKIGSATNLLAFYGGTAVAKAAAVTPPAGGGTVDAEARAAIVALINGLKTTGGVGLFEG